MDQTSIARLFVDGLPTDLAARDLDALDSQSFKITIEPDTEWRTLPVDRLQVIQGLLLKVDRIVCARLGGQLDQGVLLAGTPEAPALLFLWDCQLDDAPTTNLRVLYSWPEGDPAVNIEGVAFGIGIFRPEAADYIEEQPEVLT